MSATSMHADNRVAAAHPAQRLFGFVGRYFLVIAFFALIALFSARHFGRFHGGNFTERS